MRKAMDIICECRDADEEMTLREFTYCLNVIKHHVNASIDEDANIIECCKHTRLAKKIERGLASCFEDKNDNLTRWLNREPCYFKHPETEVLNEVIVPDSYEAIYYFLIYCMRLNRHKRISEELYDYLLYLLLDTRRRTDFWD